MDELEWGSFEDVDFDYTPTEKKPQAFMGEIVDEKALKRYVKNEDIHLKRARHLDDLCPRPRPGEQWRIVTEKSMNAYCFIRSLLEEEEIEELHIAIYRINQPTVIALTRLIEEGRIKSAHFIICSFFMNTRKPEEWAVKLVKFCDEHPNARCAYVNNHSKVACARTNGGGYYVFEGSGNLSDNGRIEQYTYENSKQMWEFHTGWMNKTIEDFKQKKNGIKESDKKD